VKLGGKCTCNISEMQNYNIQLLPPKFFKNFFPREVLHGPMEYI